MSLVTVLNESRIEISFCKITNAQVYAELRNATVTDAYRMVGDVRAAKPEFTTPLECRCWIDTDANVHAIIHNFMARFNARWGVRDPNVWWRDYVSVERFKQVLVDQLIFQN